MKGIALLISTLACASAFQAPASKLGAAQLPRAPARTADLRMEEPSSKAVTIGAAAVGGVLGVYVFHELSTAVFLSLALAYASTTASSFGDATKSAGSFAAKVYDKTLEINEQYDVLPKAKGAADTVVTAAGNLNANYGITAKIDEQLKISAAVEKATDKIEEIKGTVTDKVEDLKAKASA